MPEPSAPRSPGWPRNTRRRTLSLAITLLVALAAVWAITDQQPVAAVESEADAAHASTQNAEPDFSKFVHTSGAHSRLPCATCHRRAAGETQAATRPGHRPCAGCHSQKFAALSGPICTVCHKTAEPKDGALKPPPTLKSFGVRFEHSRHAKVSCASCHKFMDRGNAMTIPKGATAHTTCYQCHNAGAQSNGRDISSCSTCHAQNARTARTVMAAKAYQVNFSHAAHTTKAKLSCAECHRLRAGIGRDQVSEPQPLMHHAAPAAQSCMTCHNDKRTFGGDDFADCKRCHTGPTFRFKK
ncbi:MAG TPA: cytochrome c3 family protein [Blastocatellia bacterium]|nr:cytochrome c3 family protein [Blastocatellia bacterium]